jgi:hypothetical protein
MFTMQINYMVVENVKFTLEQDRKAQKGRYNSTLYLGARWRWWLIPHPDRFTPRKDMVSIV